MRIKRAMLLPLAATAAILAVVLLISFRRTSSQVPTPLPTEPFNSQNSVSWEEGKNLITGCKVYQTTELHSGAVRLELTDGSAKSVKPYNQDELYEIVQKVPATCGFAIVIAIE